MRKSLILLLPLYLYLWISVSLAQTPQVVIVPKSQSPAHSPDLSCSAGTFTIGQRIGFTNDVTLDTLFLCFGDSVQIVHKGDAIFNDPNPATPSGIAYAFYKCPPTKTGSDVIVLSDTCLWPGASSGFFVTSGPPTGTHWFFNTGQILNSTLFCQGKPCLIHFAPITITRYPDALEPGCVNVGVNNAFAVVYLTPIQVVGIDTAFQGNGCMGKFRPRGGFAEWNPSAPYKIRIYRQGQPDKKALIYTPPAQWRHNIDVIFSVPEPGVYVVEVSDEKSCPLSFTMNMSRCNAGANALIETPDLVATQNTIICVPILVENFTNIFGTSFSISWDTSMFKYIEVKNPHPNIEPFSRVGNLNENDTLAGFLGFTYSEFLGVGTSIPNGEPIFELCLLAKGPIDSCTQLTFGSYPTVVTVDKAAGVQVAVTALPGKLCIDSIPTKASFFVAKPNCDNTASIAAVIESGIPPYVVSWQACTGGQSNFVVSKVADTILTLPLPEGCWEVCVTDQNGLGTRVCDSLDISIPELGVTLSVVQLPTCHGNKDGILRADVSIDGVLVPNPGNNYTFQWNTVPPQTTQIVSGLGAGQYRVTVTSKANGCTQLAAGTLSQPAPLALNIQTTNASCPGASNGVILATASGGTPDAQGRYLFQWEYANCDSIQRSPDDSFNGNPYNSLTKPSGCYFVTVTDVNGCTYVHPTPVRINNARDFTVNLVSLTNPLCASQRNGAIEVRAVATPPFSDPLATFYAFVWTPIPPTPPGPYPQVNVNESSRLSQLPAGTYEVTVLEAVSGCSAKATYTLKDPPPVDVTVLSQANPLCTQPTGGRIKVQASGGTGSTYTYSWKSDPPQTLPAQDSLSNLGPGIYTVTVRDANGCTDSATVILSLPGPPSINGIDSVPVVCGNDGCLRVIAPTATSFIWTNAAGNQIGTTAQVCQLSGGTYTVTIRDAQSCTNTATISLASKTPLAITDSLLRQPTCNGGVDGSIAITVQGGNPGYIYKWSNNLNTPIIFPISAGTYTVTISDTRNCTLVRSFVLPDAPAIVLQYNNVRPARCLDTCDGGVELVAFYATNPPTRVNFDFEWKDGGTDSVRTNLCAGYNTVIVRDPQKGCFRIDSVQIGAPPPLTAAFANDSVSCFGGSDGRSRVTVSGGNGQPYSYLWSNGQTSPTATGLSAGPITLTVTDNRGCRRVFNTDVLQPEQIQITTPIGGIAPPKCFGGNDGQITISVSKGTPPYKFSWASAAGPAGTTNPLTNLKAGTYTVTVVDNKNCSATQFFLLNDPPPIVGSFLPIEPIRCHGEETTLYIDTITGGAGAPYQYSIDFGVYLAPTFPISIGGGKHYITYIDRVGCERTDSFFVFEPAPIVVKFDPSEVEIQLGDTLFQLIPIITGANVDTFIWKPAELLSNPKVLEPYVRTFESQRYTLTVFDAKGCSASGSILVTIDPNRNVYIPNVFIPGNTRGLNDYFTPYVGLGVERINFMRVFDRWGNLMYERTNFYPNNNDLTEGWDGRYKGQYVPPGVYVYLIEVKFLDGRVLLYRGDVTVLR
ncbi:MAG: gliding motility-associated C-terminal domain-containing protein [Saprospiraceae bacterium]|nr:gliding motility-associated C-terminal domain-containing protein [Saprospiraceae bacterium]MDW8482737.1 gliding motility-associated C-terminal domain-containing protein [Saprospiraceae bacterium]